MANIMKTIHLVQEPRKEQDSTINDDDNDILIY